MWDKETNVSGVILFMFKKTANNATDFSLFLNCIITNVRNAFFENLQVKKFYVCLKNNGKC